MEQMSINAAQHDFLIHRRRQGWYVAAIVILHLALLWVATRPARQDVPHDGRVWLTLMPSLPPAQEPIPPATPAPRPLPAARAAPASPPDASPPKAATPAATVSPPERPEDHAVTTAPAPAPPASGTSTLAQQALQAVGAIDRQLRAEHPQEFTAPPDTPQSRLAKGFAEAHAAVKPKWFEAARIELFSAPNDPRRIYRVVTASGEYCIYLPDKGSMSLNLSARSGYAGFGEGTAAPCPIRF